MTLITPVAVNRAMAPENQMQTSLLEPGDKSPKYWPTLAVDEQAFVASYVGNAYSLAATSEELELPIAHLRRMLSVPNIKKAVTEVQEAMGDIEWLNEKWVKTQLLRIFPMVMGDEEVPMIDSTGCQIHARKFVPDVAVKILEYVSPKKAPMVQIDITNTIDLRSAVEEGHARRKAAIENGRNDTVTITVNAPDEEDEDAAG